MGSTIMKKYLLAAIALSVLSSMTITTASAAQRCYSGTGPGKGVSKNTAINRAKSVWAIYARRFLRGANPSSISWSRAHNKNIRSEKVRTGRYKAWASARICVGTPSAKRGCQLRSGNCQINKRMTIPKSLKPR